MTILKTLIEEIAENVNSNKEHLVKKRFDTDLNLYSKEGFNELQNWREELIDIFVKSISIDLDETYNHLTK